MGIHHKQWIDGTKKVITAKLPTTAAGNGVPKELSIPTESILGKFIQDIGVLYVDSNWIRVYGSGCDEDKNSSIQQRNGGEGYEGLLVVADDVIGGIFAINTGRFTEGYDEVFYFGPDTLEWENLDYTYSELLYWVLFGDTELFYQDYKWDTWEDDIKGITTDRSILIYPYIWEEGEGINGRSRKCVTTFELNNINFDMQTQINGQ